MAITGILPGTYRVSVVHQSYAPAQFDITVDENTPESVFRIEPGGKLRLHVVDRRGAGVPGATIEIVDDGGQDVLEDAGIFNIGGPRANVTDAQGFVLVEQVPTGTCRVVAKKDGCDEVVVGECVFHC